MTIDRSLGHTGWGLADAELFQGQSLPTRVRAPRPRISLERPVISCHGCAQLPCFGVALSSLQQRTIHGLQSLRPAFPPSSPPQRCPRAQQHPRQGWSGDNASLEHMRQQSGIKRDRPSSPSCLACVVWPSCIAIAWLLLAVGRARPKEQDRRQLPSHRVGGIAPPAPMRKSPTTQAKYSLWSSNPRPTAHRTIALTTELGEHLLPC